MKVALGWLLASVSCWLLVGCAPPLPKAELDSRDKLKEIGRAFLKYDEVHSTMPDNMIGEDGTPLLSWRVMLLPYLGQNELFKEFHLNEPWDSTHNKILLKMMPEAYASSRLSVKEPGYTAFVGFSGPKALFRRERSKPRPIVAVLDGTSNTLLAVETSTPVPWTKPEDIPFEPSSDLPAFGAAYGNLPYAVFVDGTVYTLNLKRMHKETLKRLVTPDGGEIVGEWYRE